MSENSPHFPGHVFTCDFPITKINGDKILQFLPQAMKAVTDVICLRWGSLRYWEKMGVATMWVKAPPKRWPTGCTFWVNCYLEITFLNLHTSNPPLNSHNIVCEWFPDLYITLYQHFLIPALPLDWKYLQMTQLLQLSKI